MTATPRDAGHLLEDERDWGRLEEKALPAPWEVRPSLPYHTGPTLFSGRGEHNQTIVRSQNDWQQTWNQFYFIAAARTAVPELLRRLEAARRENAKLREYIRTGAEIARLVEEEDPANPPAAVE